MDGNVKKILIVVMAAVLIVSSLAIMAAVKKNIDAEKPGRVIESSLNVGNPVKDLDKNGDNKADFAEVSVDANDNEANSMVDENHDGVADSQETASGQMVNAPDATATSSKGYTSTSSGDGDNASLLKPANLTDTKIVNNLFPGYSNNIKLNMEKRAGMITIGKFVRKAAYDIPEPDMQWIKSRRDIARRIAPGMDFGPNGFNDTNINFTSVRHVEKKDANHDGNPEYFKLVEYSNATIDLNNDGKYDVQIIRYHELLFYDNNSDGNHEYQKWIRVFAYLEDKDHNGYYEKKIVRAVGGEYRDDNSDGNKNMFKAYAIGNQTVDENQNQKYEFHLAMLGYVIKYDNNSNGNWESVKAFFGVKAIADQNEDGVPEYLGASVTGYILTDKNDDGNPENETFIHWRYMKTDEDSNGIYEDVRGVAAYATYYDNNSDGNHEYCVAAIKGVSYRDANQNGKPENGIVGYAYYKAKDSNDDGHNESVLFRMAIVNGTDKDENGIYEHAWKLYVAHTYYDNNSDGNPEYKNFLMAGWVIDDKDQNKIWEHAGIVYMDFTMRDNNSDGNPESTISKIFYREIWDPNQDKVYNRERGVAEVGYRYDNNSNGVFEKGSLKMFGYSLYRNSTTNNISHITMIAIIGNFTNTDDEGFNEYENHTLVVVTKDDANANGNPEHVHVWIVKHRQYEEFNSTANATWLYNKTFTGVYGYEDLNDNGKRDSWWLKGTLTIRIDYDLDGIWDYESSTTVNQHGSDE